MGEEGNGRLSDLATKNLWDQIQRLQDRKTARLQDIKFRSVYAGEDIFPCRPGSHLPFRLPLGQSYLYYRQKLFPWRN